MNVIIVDTDNKSAVILIKMCGFPVFIFFFIRDRHG